MAVIGTRGYPSYYGGFETAVRRLAPYLADAGWDVTVYGRPGATKTDDPSRDMRVRTHNTIGIESKSLSTLSFGLSSVLHACLKKPDVVLVMNVANGFWLPLLKLRGIPTLVNVDGIEWERAKWGRLAKALFRAGARATARWGSRMIYDAEAIAKRWEDEFGLDGFVIPYGGDDPGVLEPVEGLKPRSYVLLVARFVPENSVREFIESVRLLPKNMPVVIVGSSGHGGELDDAVEQLARDLSNVRWLGHVNDHEKLLALWQHSGVYFHGHSVGGTNPALVQAMACGAPVVARDTIYNREVLQTAGCFVEPVPSSIASAIRDVMGDTARQTEMSAASRTRAAAAYTWFDVCKSYERALEITRSEQTRQRDSKFAVAAQRTEQEQK
ncbi:glycosyltransferase [Arthrobacter sp. NQ4]|uniref:glycosyltransferase n=1 Tax=Arthrobacter sp. NQ4 TaxID=3027930 RepID=UPI0023B16708|nr:glycosyltransferase [Arthrobacter sp. NQ4]MDE8585928.1 glycosyltransferase [Arthrobacter sp. NQ4]